MHSNVQFKVRRNGLSLGNISFVIDGTVIPFLCVDMHTPDFYRLNYNGIIVMFICQLIVFPTDLSKAYLSVVAMITLEARSWGVQALISFFSSDNWPIFLILSSILFYMVGLTGFGLHPAVSSSLPPCFL